MDRAFIRPGNILSAGMTGDGEMLPFSSNPHHPSGHRHGGDDEGEASDERP
jgi:hypothetical protein